MTDGASMMMQPDALHEHAAQVNDLAARLKQLHAGATPLPAGAYGIIGRFLAQSIIETDQQLGRTVNSLAIDLACHADGLTGSIGSTTGQDGDAADIFQNLNPGSTTPSVAVPGAGGAGPAGGGGSGSPGVAPGGGHGSFSGGGSGDSGGGSADSGGGSGFSGGSSSGDDSGDDSGGDDSGGDDSGGDDSGGDDSGGDDSGGDDSGGDDADCSGDDSDDGSDDDSGGDDCDGCDGGCDGCSGSSGLSALGGLGTGGGAVLLGPDGVAVPADLAASMAGGYLPGSIISALGPIGFGGTGQPLDVPLTGFTASGHDSGARSGDAGYGPGGGRHHQPDPQYQNHGIGADR